MAYNAERNSFAFRRAESRSLFKPPVFVQGSFVDDSLDCK